MAFPSSVYDRRGDLRLPGPIALPVSGREWEEGLLGRPYCRIRVLFLHQLLYTFLSQGLQVHKGVVQAYISLYRLVCTHIVWFVVRMNVDLRRMAALNVDNYAFSSL